VAGKPNRDVTGLRICLVMRNPVDWRSVKSARFLAAAGADVTILAFSHDVIKSKYADESFQVVVASPIESPPSRLKFFALRGVSNRTLRKLGTAVRRRRFGVFGTHLMADKIIDLGPDVIHAVNPDVLEACTLAARRLGAYLVYEAHEYWPDHKREVRMSYRKQNHIKVVENDLDASVDICVTVSDELASNYQSEYDLNVRPGIIYNAPLAIASTPSLVGDSVRAIFVGNLQEERGVFDILDAVKHTPSIDLTFLGGGEAESLLAKKIKAYNLEGRVHLMKPVLADDVVETVNRYDIGILAHKPINRQMDGALPNKFFEYLSAGLAVVATKTTALANFADKEGSGFIEFFENVNAESIAFALANLTGNKERLSRMKSAALKIGQQYAGDAQGRRLVAAYESMLQVEPKAYLSEEQR